MDKPKVSVCIVTYNQEAFIKDAIEGALMQKDVDLEIIIADDCSTDGTSEICEEYRLRFPGIIKLIKNSTNLGIIKNTQACLAAAKGEYIAICEGDDYWTDSDKLKKQVRVLDNEPDVSMVHTSYINLWIKEMAYHPAKWVDANYHCEFSCGEESVKEIMHNRYRGIRFSTVCFRRELLLQAQSENYIYSNDFTTLDIVIFYEMAYRGRFVFLKDETTIYRCLWESVSSTRDLAKRARFQTGVLAIDTHYIKRYNLKPNYYCEALTNSISNIINGLMVSKDRYTAKKLMRLVESIDYNLKFTHRLCIFSIMHNILGYPGRLLYKIKTHK